MLPFTLIQVSVQHENHSPAFTVTIEVCMKNKTLTCSFTVCKNETSQTHAHIANLNAHNLDIGYVMTHAHVCAHCEQPAALCVQGPPGTGKTHTVKGILNAWHVVGYRRYHDSWRIEAARQLALIQVCFLACVF